jgi:hypothetical protein
MKRVLSVLALTLVIALAILLRVRYGGPTLPFAIARRSRCPGGGALESLPRCLSRRASRRRAGRADLR